MPRTRSRSQRRHEDEDQPPKLPSKYDEALETGSPWRVKLEKFAYRKRYGKDRWATAWHDHYGTNSQMHFSLSSSELLPSSDPDDYSPSLTPSIFQSLLQKHGLGSFNWSGVFDVKDLDRLMKAAAETGHERWREEDERCSHKEFDRLLEKYGLRNANVGFGWDRRKTPEEYEAIMIAEAREREEWVRRNRESYRERREDGRRRGDGRREKPRRLVGRRDDERDVQEEIEKRFAGRRDGRKRERGDRARVAKQRKESNGDRVLRSASIDKQHKA